MNWNRQKNSLWCSNFTPNVLLGKMMERFYLKSSVNWILRKGFKWWD